MPSPLYSTSMDALALLASEPAAAALFLDVDGVLAPIVERPEDARVPRRDARRAGAARPACTGSLPCVTGRSSDVAQAIVGVSGLRYAGEHGLELDRAAAAWADPIHAFARDAAVARHRAEAAQRCVPLPRRRRARSCPRAARAGRGGCVAAGPPSALRPHGARGTAAARRIERHRSPSAARRGGPAAGAVCRRRHDRPERLRSARRSRGRASASQSLPTKARES